MATITYKVTVATGTNQYGTGNKYYINGEANVVLYLQEGNTYIFDQSDSTNGNIYELGGPRVVSTKELMQLILGTIGRRRLLIPTPFWYLTLVASVLELLPRPVITKDQVRSLKEDNVVSTDAKVLEDLDITSTDLEAIIPHYLIRFRKGNSRTLNSV
mgnify:CR=1 FL=1